MEPSVPRPDRETTGVTLELVIPMYNEEEALPRLLDELAKTFSPEARAAHRIDRVSCLFVDDGSRDRSVQIVRDAADSGLGMAILRLSRNFGHQAAVSAGIAHSTADLVAVMDADLQDPPACVLEMLKEWRAGYEIVNAQRRNRKEGPLKKLLYACFYRLWSWLSPIAIQVDSGDFCLMSRRVVDELNKLPETLRFPRGLRSWVGFSQTAIQYDRPARSAGQSSYGWRALYRLATDGIASVSLRPLQLSQILALLYLLVSGVGIVALLSNAFRETDIRTQLNWMLVLILLGNGLILFCVYILGSYLGRAYLEVKGRPGYVVEERVIVAEPRGPEGH